jgi:hypothetical protein
MARPKKHPAELRDAWLPPMRVTMAERVFAEEQAALAAVPLSEYGRARILGHRIRPRRSRYQDALLVELNKIGVNLNQIARTANRGQGLPHDFPEVVSELRAALHRAVEGLDE